MTRPIFFSIPSRLNPLNKPGPIPFFFLNFIFVIEQRKIVAQGVVPVRDTVAWQRGPLYMI